MNVNEVIKYPLLTEKTYAQMENKVYTFAVDPRTNRAEVKKTVEYIFGVKVAKVNIISIDKQPTKLGRSAGFTNRMKKAIITLSEGVINIFPDEVEPVADEKSKKDAKKSNKDETKKEMSEAEKKAAAKIAAKLAEKEDRKEVKPQETKPEAKPQEIKAEIKVETNEVKTDVKPTETTTEKDTKEETK